VVNKRTWWRVFRKPIPADRKAREAKVKRVREAAFGPVTPETRAEDRQRLAEAAAGKRGGLI
jgi:hypothetical protein